jgi:hypothetical protein
MSRIALIFLSTAALFAADNRWGKVIALPNRSELRTYQKGVHDAIIATLADATEERIVVVVKNKQMTIAKEDIERLDARPVEPKKKPETTTTQTTSDPDLAPRLGAGPPVSTTSTSSGMSFGGNKPDFKTIYVKPPATPKN